MEKILEFNKGKLWDENTKWYRFQCDCLSPADAMDITVDACGKGDEGKYLTITMHFLGTGVFNRLKYAWQIIRGYWTWREFVVREEDCKELSRIFDPDIKYSDLP